MSRNLFGSVIIFMLTLQKCKCVLLWWQNNENKFIVILILVKHIFLSIPSCQIGTLKEKLSIASVFIFLHNCQLQRNYLDI